MKMLVLTIWWIKASLGSAPPKVAYLPDVAALMSSMSIGSFKAFW